MRKIVYVLLALAMLPVGLFAAEAGAATASVPTCKTEKGTGKFTPALPPFSSKTLVKATFTATETLTGCTGGGVTSAIEKQVYKASAGMNCTTLTKPSTQPVMKGTETVTWNGGKTSTVTGAMALFKGITSAGAIFTITGKVTKGPFAGVKTGEALLFTPPTGGCSKGPVAVGSIFDPPLKVPPGTIIL